ncbi:nitrilase [Xylogone sp. PMI_703]|nr:nitrilase [Xylogone sp. PMI_703]
MPPIRAAACHVSAVFLSARATTEKAISLIHQAAKNQANLVVFPESYIPAFPVWSALRPPTENHGFFKQMVKQSVYVDGEEISAIKSAAKATNTIVSIGISEKARHSSATLYNSNLIIGTNGELLVHHRKLMPTFFEKLTWAQGDGFGLKVADTPFGKIGNLICGENTNPLARYSLMTQGEQLHISTWPAVWPTRASNATGGTNTPNIGSSSVAQGANYDNVAANRTRAAAHCFEAKCFGILSSAILNNDAIELISSNSIISDSVRDTLEKSSRSPTMFLDPTGALLPGFTISQTSGEEEAKDFLQHEEGILYADMNLDDCIEGKQYHDVVGGYQRFDVFQLKVDRRRREPAVLVDEATIPDLKLEEGEK